MLSSHIVYLFYGSVNIQYVEEHYCCVHLITNTLDRGHFTTYNFKKVISEL